jgi:nicotinamide mononucleotide transporter
MPDDPSIERIAVAEIREALSLADRYGLKLILRPTAAKFNKKCTLRSRHGYDSMNAVWNRNTRLMKAAYGSACALSLAVGIAAHWHWIALSEVEVWGFITGGWCVWLTVQESIWTWPIGLANNVFFFALFLQARLFADMALQIVYIVLGVLGWYWWLFGGRERSTLSIASASGTMAASVGVLVIVSTFALTLYLTRIRDSAPFPDALTTALSLGAQFLLSKKLLENWYLWITADVIYVWLYAYKGLFLTSALYALFLGMCFAGFFKWRASLHRPISARATA